MSNDDIKRIIEEATKETLRESFTEAGQKYIKAAGALEQRGDFPGAEKLYQQAAATFSKAAEKYRASKSFKNAALNMTSAGDILSDMGQSVQAIAAYSQAADDLFAAAGEHLMWGEDAETKKGATLAIAGSMIYIMIGKDAEGFHRARTFAAENASKMMFPAIVRLSQIPQMLESAIQSVDVNAFASAENAVVTELKAALASSGAQEFSKYVDKGLDMVREILRGKLKVPKIIMHLDLPVDMTFAEQFPLRVIIQNVGDGAATKLRVEWHIDEGLDHMSGEKARTISSLPPSESATFEIIVKSSQELMGVKEYSILVRGSYMDELNTEYSLQAGPGTLVLKDFKMSEKIVRDLDVTEARVEILGSTIDESPLDKNPMHRIVEGLSKSLKQVRTDVDEKDLDTAKARLGVVNQMVDAMDAILGDEVMMEGLAKTRNYEKKVYARSVLEPIHNNVISAITEQERKMESEASSTKTESPLEAEKKRKVVNTLTELKSKTSEIIRDLDAIYSQIPSAATTDMPDEAARRTRLRSAIDSARTKTVDVESNLGNIAKDEVFTEGPALDVPTTAELTLVILRSLRNSITQMMDEKKAELE
jgi:hypothetical protein